MKLGIVGLPNVGKSTLFNSLTKAGALSANYPFATIDPNVGIVSVPDERIVKLGELYHTKKVTPATIEFVDIAGLVKGASKGEGLGNQFLANIREVDAIVHVVLLKLPFFTTDMKKKFFANLWLTFHSWSPSAYFLHDKRQPLLTAFA